MDIRKIIDRKKIKVVLFLFILFFMFLSFSIKNAGGKMISGIAGSDDGSFAVGYYLNTSEKDSIFLFYDKNCVLINTAELKIRGGAFIADIDGYAAVCSRADSGILYTYDYSGDLISENKDLPVKEPVYSIEKSNYSIRYEQDEKRNEHIYYTKNGETKEVDIGYKKYKTKKLNEVWGIFFCYILVFIICVMIDREKKRSDEENNV